MVVLPNFVKSSYGWSPLGQHHKIEKERKKENPIHYTIGNYENMFS